MTDRPASDEPIKNQGRKNGRVSLHPLKFEDALRGLLKVKPPKKDESNSRSGEKAPRE